MGSRPTRDGKNPPTQVEFGIVALGSELETADVDYPTDGSSLVDGLGNPDVPIDPTGRTVPLSSAMAEAEKDRFESERELLDALHPIFESYRDGVSGGILATLRGLLPY